MVGIKPTRLWYLTPSKYVMRALNDRFLAGKNFHEQRDRKGIVLLIAMTFTFASGLAYSFGKFNPKKIFCPGPAPPPESKKKKKCQRKKGSQPCPDEETGTVAPCPAEVKLAAKKH